MITARFVTNMTAQVVPSSCSIWEEAARAFVCINLEGVFPAAGLVQPLVASPNLQLTAGVLFANYYLSSCFSSSLSSLLYSPVLQPRPVRHTEWAIR